MANKKTVKIDITGVTGTGKSFIGLLIANTLRDKDITTTVDGDILKEGANEIYGLTTDDKKDINHVITHNVEVVLEAHTAPKPNTTFNLSQIAEAFGDAVPPGILNSIINNLANGEF
jgi:CO dehydrogenase nickel-insertion accessory protein CooC1